MQLDPEAAVLSVRDLPSYKLISSSQAKGPGGETTRSGWDNVFQKSEAGATDYRMVESIVVVYGSAADAAAGVDELRQTEESHGATGRPGVVGIQSTTWLEPLGIPGFALVRVVFRTDNVVAQVGLLGDASATLTDEVQALALAQEMRLQMLRHDRG